MSAQTGMGGRAEWDAMMAWLDERAPNRHARLAKDHLLRIEMTREALINSNDMLSDAAQKLEENIQLMAAIGRVLDVLGRGTRQQAKAHEVIEAAVDHAPFRNLMANMYGLGPMGEARAKPPARKKALAVKAQPEGLTA